VSGSVHDTVANAAALFVSGQLNQIQVNASVLRNVSAATTGVISYDSVASTFQFSGNFGAVGADNNTPRDIRTGANTYDYGAAAVGSCTSVSCTCMAPGCTP